MYSFRAICAHTYFFGSAMPIYAYKCASCGYAKDVLQKISDAHLTVCPQCGKPTFHKQVTAASFQLKGTGWYVTDFRGGSSSSTSSGASPGTETKTEPKPDQAKTGEAKGESKAEPTSGSDATPAAPTPATPTPSSSGGAASSD